MKVLRHPQGTEKNYMYKSISANMKLIAFMSISLVVEKYIKITFPHQSHCDYEYFNSSFT